MEFYKAIILKLKLIVDNKKCVKINIDAACNTYLRQLGKLAYVNKHLIFIVSHTFVHLHTVPQI